MERKIHGTIIQLRKIEKKVLPRRGSYTIARSPSNENKSASIIPAVMKSQ